MSWFSNLFKQTTTRRSSPSARPQNRFRPTLEALEDRQLMSASVVSDAIAGRPELFTVNTGRLNENTTAGPSVLRNGVQSIEAGTDASGRHAVFSLLNDGTLGEYTSGGAWSV